jgi:hypothetical protein
MGFPTSPSLHFSRVPNHRPEVAARPAIPTKVRVRADLEPDLRGALDGIADHGAALPLLGAPAALPVPGGGEPDDDDVLATIGRLVRVVRAAALSDPDADAVALARPDGGGDLRVVARVLDEAAPRAGEVTAAAWEAFTCDSAQCSSGTADRKYLEVEPLLAEAGWHHPVPEEPSSLGDQGRWDRFYNVTGLVAGETTLGSELRLFYSGEEITASPLRERLTDVWDGERFSQSDQGS